MRQPTESLVDAALDYAVFLTLNESKYPDRDLLTEVFMKLRGTGESVNYSTNWAAGGPVIERYGIDIRQLKWPGEIPDIELHETENPNDGKWLAKRAWTSEDVITWRRSDFMSDTPLIAAMRCFVFGRRGDSVDIPDAVNTVTKGL